MPTLVNIDRNVNIKFEFSDEPRDIMKEITQQGAVGSIGLISLRSLIAGNIAEVSGYLIMEDETSEEKVPEETVAEVVAEEKVPEETVAEEKVPEAVIEEKAPEEKAPEEKAPEEKAPELTPEERKAAANEAIKKTFGVKLDNSEGNFTPAEKTSESKRPRRDMSALLAKAKAGVNAPLLAAVEAANYTVVNVENRERWFGVTHNEFELVRSSPRFDISVLKNGSYSISLYVNDLATGLKCKVGSEVAKVDAIAEVVKLMASDLFKEALASYKAPEAETKA